MAAEGSNGGGWRGRGRGKYFSKGPRQASHPYNKVTHDVTSESNFVRELTINDKMSLFLTNVKKLKENYPNVETTVLCGALVGRDNDYSTTMDDIARAVNKFKYVQEGNFAEEEEGHDNN